MPSLDLQKGDKVAACWHNWRNHSYGEILEILTVKNITARGTIVTVDDHGRMYQYTREGYGKGQARGSIRKVTEEEIVKFLKSKQKEKEKIIKEQKEKEEDYEREVEACYEWAKQHATIQIINTINVQLEIVDLPVPKHPSSLVIRFTHRYLVDNGKDYSAHIDMFEDRYNDLNTGHTIYTVKRGKDTLYVAGMWLKHHFGIEKLKGEENVGT